MVKQLKWGMKNILDLFPIYIPKSNSHYSVKCSCCRAPGCVPSTATAACWMLDRWLMSRVTALWRTWERVLGAWIPAGRRALGRTPYLDLAILKSLKSVFPPKILCGWSWCRRRIAQRWKTSASRRLCWWLPRSPKICWHLRGLVGWCLPPRGEDDLARYAGSVDHLLRLRTFGSADDLTDGHPLVVSRTSSLPVGMCAHHIEQCPTYLGWSWLMVKLCVVFVCVWAALEYLECCFARSSHGVVPMPKTWWRVKKARFRSGSNWFNRNDKSKIIHMWEPFSLTNHLVNFQCM